MVPRIRVAVICWFNLFGACSIHEQEVQKVLGDGQKSKDAVPAGRRWRFHPRIATLNSGASKARALRCFHGGDKNAAAAIGRAVQGLREAAEAMKQAKAAKASSSQDFALQQCSCCSCCCYRAASKAVSERGSRTSRMWRCGVAGQYRTLILVTASSGFLAFLENWWVRIVPALPIRESLDPGTSGPEPSSRPTGRPLAF